MPSKTAKPKRMMSLKTSKTYAFKPNWRMPKDWVHETEQIKQGDPREPSHYWTYFIGADQGFLRVTYHRDSETYSWKPSGLAEPTHQAASLRDACEDALLWALDEAEREMRALKKKHARILLARDKVLPKG